MPSAPPTTPAPSGDSLSNPQQQVCITPPSHRRREARIAYCATVRARRAGEERDAAGGVADGPEPERTAYRAEEVDARRAARVEPVEWMGWEAEGEAYAGERYVGHLATGPEGLGVGWEAAPEQWRDNDIALGLDANLAEGGWAELDSPVDAQAHQVGQAGGWQTTLPTLGGANGALGTTALPSNTIPLVLGALYLLARAMGVGTSGGRRADGDVQGKVREMGRRM